MLKPPRKLALAVEAIVDIAYHGSANPVQSQDIARRLGLPRRYLEQVMQQLVRAGVLRGVRGPRGGYRLARERRRITLGEIVRVLQQNVDEEGAVPHSQSQLGARVMAPLWASLAESMMERLDAITIEDLCRRAEQEGVESEAEPNPDFAI
ncbi:MAG TPA: Rrf2 family transcriptional regulator [Rhodospirillales bacterium]|nr:Rrf2 family transcriptional regulator [Rhodospirillales bacterium]